jgi:ATP-dependent DNA helicase RecQ
MADLAAAQKLLRTVFGFAEFRAGQAEIIETILAGRDVLAVMPTGSGKSLCYQLPALMRGGLTIVVSPLIALMRNQVAQLRGYGIAAASLNSTNDFDENRTIVEQIARGELRLAYVAPERLAKPETVALLRRAKVGLLAVDEAHCISQWGHDFRPDYMNLAALQNELGPLQTIAFTATADAATRADILSRLFRQQPQERPQERPQEQPREQPQVFVHGFDRPNLRLAMSARNHGRGQLAQFISGHRGDSGIIYCASRRRAEDIAAFLRDEGVKALHYHAGMDAADRSRNQDVFLQEDGVVMAATIAFGMGIDKPDVRFVCHHDLPNNIESYYQEIGRAGRDGLPADTLTLFSTGDIGLRRRQIEESTASDDQKRVDRLRLNALVALCESPRCRRQALLGYFGETVPSACGNCDICADSVAVVDGTIAAQKAMSAIVRTGERFGTEHLINLLLGEETEAIRNFRHDALPTFGVGKEHNRNEWRSIFRQLYAAGLLSLDIAGYGRWTIQPAGRAVLKGQTRIELRRQAVTAPGKKAARKAAAAATLGASSADHALFEALRARRSALAKAQAVPAYVILPDRSLLEMARSKPMTLREMGGIHGVGEIKLKLYGEEFLDVIHRHQASPSQRRAD